MNALTEFRLNRHLDEMVPWNDRQQLLEIIDIVDEAPEVKTFTFRADGQTWFRYKPGQFVTLELPLPDGPLMRTYTLSSSPSRPFSIAVTVKAQGGSVGTRWMFNHLTVGARIRAFGPAGDFSLHSHPAAKYFFISAGSGITPMMSMLRWLNDCAPATDVACLNCARRPEDLIFREELELLGQRMPRLALTLMVKGRSMRENWFGHVGRLDAARLPLLAPDFRDREIFCCGPDAFMRSVREMLGAAGFDMARYHEESFAMPVAPVRETAPAAAPAVPSADAMQIRFALSDVEGFGAPDESLLTIARAAGVRIPAACESGLCGTCKVKKVSGDVEMNHNGGILDEEIEEGFILACCSQPRSAVEIEA
ncbi:hybrid-cluster NAD(P)-dependent oxidoreductase [Methylovirgula sp. 4M-Z18]|uniref:hybrid-cluster NAD(P)-dependent oxidoreductase n=1 Tax=Methylovirgula sp. 4M-Z18 TaxID=2293567 RepID=UPI000E2EA324|nr:hybrid-cluster NAD(P)-dependent oxidoreductase [Methylovirgula sp. 4M-Z18]RFB79866.1 hybrid-cluster NAD(P)-dependent oxidoreductase [Methylovirgula sp. 4M-Z18]